MKGLSPLIAAVILIAVTMGIAGVLALWATGFMKSKLSESENVTVQTSCLAAEFTLRYGKYDKEKRSLYLVLDNTKNVDLQITNLYLIYPNNRLESKTINKTLKGGEMLAINIDDVDVNFTKGTIKTNCPEVSLDFTYSQVTS